MTSAAELYGKSLYELAVSEHIEEEVCAQAKVCMQLFRENPDYIRLLSEPSIHLADRQKLLDEAFGGQVHPYLLNFMKLLMEKGMISEFGTCYRTMRRLYNHDHNIAQATVTCAVPLSDDQRQRLLTKLQRLSGKEVELKEKVDPKVLGGLRVEIDGHLLDGTVQTRLHDLRQKVDQTII